MNRKDHLKDWFRELPQEQVSSQFTSRVMQRVMSEWSLNPYKYQPIISKKAWWTMAFAAVIITGLLFSLHSSVSGDYTSHSPSFYQVPFTSLFNFLGQLFNKLNNISPAFAIGALAVVALWFFDQLFSRTVKH